MWPMASRYLLPAHTSCPLLSTATRANTASRVHSSGLVTPVGQVAPQLGEDAELAPSVRHRLCSTHNRAPCVLCLRNRCATELPKQGLWLGVVKEGAQGDRTEPPGRRALGRGPRKRAPGRLWPQQRVQDGTGRSDHAATALWGGGVLSYTRCKVRPRCPPSLALQLAEGVVPGISCGLQGNRSPCAGEAAAVTPEAPAWCPSRSGSALVAASQGQGHLRTVGTFTFFQSQTGQHRKDSPVF